MSTNLGQILRALLELLLGALVTIWEWLTGSGHDHEQHDHEHPLQYFLPGKIILLVDHPTGLDPTQLAALISPTIEEQWANQLEPPDPDAILIFPLENSQRQVFSLVPVETTSSDQQGLVNLLLEVYDWLKDQPVEVSPNVSIRTVSPDWLLGTLNHAPRPTSPGSWPVPAPAPNPNDLKFSLLDPKNGTSSPLPFASEDGSGIDIAILDTAPERPELDEAYNKWHARYDMVESLLNPGTGKLRVYSAVDPAVDLMEYGPVGHRYLMSDHGLFVASIIHGIAPQANLHLIKTFTPYGTGGAQTIGQGVLQVLHEFRDPAKRDTWRPLIINCSFGLTIPEPGKNGNLGHDPTDFPVELRDPEILKHMSTSLRELFNRLADQGDILVVAAAGNDSDGRGRQPTRYPAAYEKVLGVGALPKDASNSPGRYRAASYSNRPDDQNPDEGYMTLGGEPGPGKGVLGLYIGELPVYREGCLSFLWRSITGKSLDGWLGPGHVPPKPRALTLDHVGYTRNETGWAWWAGTSFATPIVTGFCAARWSGAHRGQPLNCATAEAELDLHSERIRPPHVEKAFHVKQG